MIQPHFITAVAWQLSVMQLMVSCLLCAMSRAKTRISATLPFNGQGAAQALEDAAVLNVLLAKVKDVREISKAFAAFDSVRRARSQRVVEIARTFGRCYVLAQDGVGDDSQLIRQLLGPAGAFTNNVDLDEQNAAALRAFEALTAKS